MNNTNHSIVCRLCGSMANKIFDSLILKKFKISYFKCNNCNIIQSEVPYWLEDAYKESISITDTGILQRNIEISKKVLIFLSIYNVKMFFQEKVFRYFKKLITILIKRKINIFKGKIYDFGGGYGILVRLLRDYGLNAFWNDPFSKNLIAKGFEDSDNRNEIVLAFEVFEHFNETKKEFLKIFQSNPDIVIFSTELYGEIAPGLDWWYYSFETGQHISFYSFKTLEFIGKLFGYKVYSFSNSFHIFSKIDLHSDLISFFMNRYEYFFPIFQKKYSSKTFSDHEYLKNKIR